MRARLVLAGLAVSLVALLPASASAVLGGQLDTAHPYVVLVTYSTPDGITTFCSGTLLSRDVVLTAAHCFAPGTTVHVYDSNVPQPGAYDSAGTFYPDPQFAGLGNGIPQADTHDVAVVILSSPIDLTTYGRLPTPGLVDKLTNNTPVDVVGYGVVGFDRGGGQPQPVFPIARFVGQTTAFKSNGAIGGEFLKLHSGICFGDSGGPDLVAGTNIVLAENSFLNNNVCAGDTYSYRVDTLQAQSWITSTVAAHGGSIP